MGPDRQTSIAYAMRNDRTDNDSAHREPAEGAAVPRRATVPAADVVIVEGDAALAEMLEYSVSNAGHEALSFRAGRSAIDYLAHELPAGSSPVVLLDLDLLGSEGFLALKEVLAARPGLRVIVLSAQGAERDQIRALRAGAIDYLVKPLSIPILVAKVERLLADRTP
jgi:DNA-binding response OmpR family regulator